MDLKGEEAPHFYSLINVRDDVAKHLGVVVITLTPLGEPQEFSRRLTINEEIKQVEVGRASRNSDKCLVSANDNAWFDSPIMSREHAKFSAMANKKIYLQDYGSTHGTYIGNQRLESHKDYSINDNDIVTFGVRVTSGARTYLAKEFRVNLEWRPLRPVSKEIKPSDVGLQSTRFHVPDYDEIDSSSESSRAASVQILDSHIRSYSVPSSGESFSTSDDEEELSPLKEVQLSESTVKPSLADTRPPKTAETTPHHAVEIRTEIPPSKKLNDSGASPLYPIEFEDEAAHQKVVPSSDIDDELPEVLSSRQIQVPSSTYLLTSFGTRARFACNAAFMDREAQEELLNRAASINHENPEKSGTEKNGTESQSNKIESQMDGSFPMKAARMATVELESTDEEDFDHPCYYPAYYGHNPSILANCPFSSTTCSNSRPRSGVTFDAAKKSIIANSQTGVTDGSNCSRLAVHGETTDVNNDENPAHEALLTRRPPSPSDAALVKKANFVDQRSFWPVMEDSQSHASADQSSEYQTQPRKVSNVGDAIPPYLDYTGMSRYVCFDNFDSLSWNSAMEHLRSRHQIPSSTTEPAQDRPGGSALLSSCSQDSNTENCASSAVSLDPNTSNSGVNHDQPKENGSHSSRLNISDIVHPQPEFTRSLKRKADEMSVNEAEAGAYEGSHVFSCGSSQDVLTDAQPREITATDETILLEDYSKTLQEVAVTVQHPSTSESHEPPRKKVKSSVSTAIGIGKFVSGVCFGVAGVFAAFIATIPLSVQEEAMQELVNSA